MWGYNSIKIGSNNIHFKKALNLALFEFSRRKANYISRILQSQIMFRIFILPGSFNNITLNFQLFFPLTMTMLEFKPFMDPLF